MNNPVSKDIEFFIVKCYSRNFIQSLEGEIELSCFTDSGRYRYRDFIN